MVVGKSVTYQASDMCHSPANQTAQQWFRSPGYIHTVLLDHLVPDTRYYYQYGNDQAGWSELASFHAAPAHPRTVRFVAFGDQDIVEASVNTSNYVYKEAVERDLDFVMHFGDLGYALGNAWRWDAWGTIISRGASQVPYMVTVGNHGEWVCEASVGASQQRMSARVREWDKDRGEGVNGDCVRGLESEKVTSGYVGRIFFRKYVFTFLFLL